MSHLATPSRARVGRRIVGLTGSNASAVASRCRTNPHRLSNDLPFSGERRTDARSYHGREEPRAQPAASRHGPRSSEPRRRSSAATACWAGVVLPRHFTVLISAMPRTPCPRTARGSRCRVDCRRDESSTAANTATTIPTLGGGQRSQVAAVAITGVARQNPQLTQSLEERVDEPTLGEHLVLSVRTHILHSWIILGHRNLAAALQRRLHRDFASLSRGASLDNPIRAAAKAARTGTGSQPGQRSRGLRTPPAPRLRTWV